MNESDLPEWAQAELAKLRRELAASIDREIHAAVAIFQLRKAALKAAGQLREIECRCA